MCLSKVYLKDKNSDNIIVEEASKVLDNNGIIEVYSIFGDVEKRENYYIKEVDLEDNYIILGRKDDQ
jgi:hypothetical protein